MPVSYNVFRVLGDVLHTSSKFILIWAIHRNKSAEGVSLITQALYLLVFGVRYLDLLWTPPSFSYWNFVLKILYILTSSYIVFLMLRVYARTRERERAWKLGVWSLGGSLIAAPILTLALEGKAGLSLLEMIYSFTLVLEAVCILPQLLLLRQTSVPTVIDSYYLVTLGSYRFFYIFNWIVRAIQEWGNLEPVFPISVLCGLVQTALYIDFAWVYYFRQRVKLRAGAVVDSQDFQKGWLVNRIVNNRKFDEEGDEEHEGLAQAEEGDGARARQQSTNRWGARGISVSADEGLEDGHANPGSKDDLADPDVFEDDYDEDHHGPVAPPDTAESAGVSDGGEWRDSNK
ncbi:hypothetical protein MBLNU457_7811t3 [Dothideomycetes sp. NU457]